MNIPTRERTKYTTGLHSVFFSMLLCLSVSLTRAADKYSHPDRRDTTGTVIVAKPKGSIADSIHLDLTIGYGVAQIEHPYSFYDFDPTLDAYLERLGLDYSENSATFTLTGSVAVSSFFGFYL